MVVVTHPGVGSVGLWCSCGSPRVGRVVPRFRSRSVGLGGMWSLSMWVRRAVRASWRCCWLRLVDVCGRVRARSIWRGWGSRRSHGLPPRPGGDHGEAVRGAVAGVVERVRRPRLRRRGRRGVVQAAGACGRCNRSESRSQATNTSPKTPTPQQRPQSSTTSACHLSDTPRWHESGWTWPPLGTPCKATSRPSSSASSRRRSADSAECFCGRAPQGSNAPPEKRPSAEAARSGPAQKRPSAEAAQRRLSRARASRRCRQRNLGWRAQRPQS